MSTDFGITNETNETSGTNKNAGAQIEPRGARGGKSPQIFFIHEGSRKNTKEGKRTGSATESTEFSERFFNNSICSVSSVANKVSKIWAFPDHEKDSSIHRLTQIKEPAETEPQKFLTTEGHRPETQRTRRITHPRRETKERKFGRI